MLSLQQVNDYTMVAIEQVALLEILTFVVGAVFFVSIGSFVGSLLRPQCPNEEKRCTYESGEEPTGSSWSKLNTQFYVVALVFMLFEVETVLLFSWATVWADPALDEATGGVWAKYTATSALVFIVLFSVGLAYVWSQGHLVGIRPPQPASFASKVPKELYDRINKRYVSTTNEYTA